MSLSISNQNWINTASWNILVDEWNATNSTDTSVEETASNVSEDTYTSTTSESTSTTTASQSTSSTATSATTSENTTNTTTSSNSIFASNSELTAISNEILSKAPVTSPISTSSSNNSLNIFNTQNTGIKVFGINSADVETLKQIATNKAGMDVSLSQNTLSAIEALKANAASLQMQNIANKVDGKIYVPAEAPRFEEKSIFAPGNAPEFAEIGDLDKDRKGSNPFVMITTKRSNQKKEG